MKVKGTVLILAYECYPFHRTGSTIGAQRPYQFAKNLSLLGWKVIVLCCDQGKRRTLPRKQMNRVVQETYTAHTDSLKNDAYTIIALPSLAFNGIGDYIWSRAVVNGPGGTYAGKPFPFSWVRKIFTFYNQLKNGDYSWSWNPVANHLAEQVIQDYKVDVLLGEHGPDAGIILADALSRKYGIPWIADFRDPVLWPFKGIFKWLYKQKVKSIVKSSFATLNVTPYWTSLDQKHFDKDAYTIVNGYDHELFEEIAPSHFPAFTISYYGSFNEEFQDIKPSLEAVSSFLKKLQYPSDVKLFYRGLCNQQFLRCCQDAGIPEEYLDVDGFIERKAAIASMKGSDVLLIYSFPTYKARNIYEKKGFYPGKIFEYIGSGSPVLLIPSDEGILASLIQEQQKGLACSSVQEAVSFLEGQYTTWKNKRQVKRFAPTDRALYSRYAQALQLDKILSPYIRTH